MSKEMSFSAQKVSFVTRRNGFFSRASAASASVTCRSWLWAIVYALLRPRTEIAMSFDPILPLALPPRFADRFTPQRERSGLIHLGDSHPLQQPARQARHRRR